MRILLASGRSASRRVLPDRPEAQTGGPKGRPRSIFSEAQGGGLVAHVHRLLLVEDRRRRLEGDPEVDRLPVGDPALDAAAPVGPRADAVALHVELVVVLAPPEVGAREAGADLEALARGQTHDRLGEVGRQAIENRLAPARP